MNARIETLSSVDVVVVDVWFDELPCCITEEKFAVASRSLSNGSIFIELVATLILADCALDMGAVAATGIGAITLVSVTG